MPASQLHLVWTAARIHPTPSPITSPSPPLVPPPSGGRDASAVESCSWLGHHWLMPGTRSSEYAHLAASPSDSCPDMEREGGQVCVLARESGGRSRAGSSPRFCITSPPALSTLAPPPVPSLAQSSSAGSRGKLLIALHQPGTGVIWRGASQRAIKGDATHSQPQSHAARRALHSTSPVAAPADPPARASAVRSGCSPASPTDRQPDPVPTPPALRTLAAPSGDQR